ncbi:MAG: hypothetical protein ACRDKY_10615, partial [Solirubrobacteraceae bacterium]
HYMVTTHHTHAPIGAVAALSAVALAAPAAAQAGTVAVDRTCYAEGAPVTMGGVGFTPGSTVSIRGDGLYGNAQVLPNGAFVYRGSAPSGYSASDPGSSARRAPRRGCARRGFRG